ncbi:MAG TPA: hypothetical protein PK711_05910 [Bacteroidales bacterium]|nr:hypothetical protein [Bacteroidales bacterium]HRZ20253.1 hypothetical protein [Bacteroidales bacterium]
MRLKPWIVLVPFMIWPVSYLHAQQHSTSFRIDVGYYAGFAGGELGTNTSSTADMHRSELIIGSVGRGFSFSASGSYFLEKNLSIELGYQFMLSPDILFEKVDEPDYYTESIARITSHYVKIGPALYMPLKRSDLTLSGRFGILMPPGRYFTIESSSSINYEQFDYAQATWKTEKYTFLFSPGFYASLDAAYPIGKKVSLYGEVAIQLASVTYKSSEIIRYKSVTNDLMNEYSYGLYNLTTAERYSAYLKELTDKNNIPTSPDFDETQPTDRLTRRLSASSVGINIGIAYSVRWKDLIHKK